MNTLSSTISPSTLLLTIAISTVGLIIGKTMVVTLTIGTISLLRNLTSHAVLRLIVWFGAVNIVLWWNLLPAIWELPSIVLFGINATFLFVSAAMHILCKMEYYFAKKPLLYSVVKNLAQTTLPLPATVIIAWGAVALLNISLRFAPFFIILPLYLALLDDYSIVTHSMLLLGGPGMFLSADFVRNMLDLVDLCSIFGTSLLFFALVLRRRSVRVGLVACGALIAVFGLHHRLAVSFHHFLPINAYYITLVASFVTVLLIVGHYFHILTPISTLVFCTVLGATASMVLGISLILGILGGIIMAIAYHYPSIHVFVPLAVFALSADVVLVIKFLGTIPTTFDVFWGVYTMGILPDAITNSWIGISMVLITFMLLLLVYIQQFGVVHTGLEFVVVMLGIVVTFTESALLSHSLPFYSPLFTLITSMAGIVICVRIYADRKLTTIASTSVWIGKLLLIVTEAMYTPLIVILVISIASSFLHQPKTSMRMFLHVLGITCVVAFCGGPILVEIFGLETSSLLASVATIWSVILLPFVTKIYGKKSFPKQILIGVCVISIAVVIFNIFFVQSIHLYISLGLCVAIAMSHLESRFKVILGGICGVFVSLFLHNLHSNDISISAMIMGLFAGYGAASVIYHSGDPNNPLLASFVMFLVMLSSLSSDGIHEQEGLLEKRLFMTSISVAFCIVLTLISRSIHGRHPKVAKFCVSYAFGACVLMCRVMEVSVIWAHPFTSILLLYPADHYTMKKAAAMGLTLALTAWSLFDAIINPMSVFLGFGPLISPAILSFSLSTSSSSMFGWLFTPFTEVLFEVFLILCAIPVLIPPHSLPLFPLLIPAVLFASLPSTRFLAVVVGLLCGYSVWMRRERNKRGQKLL